MNGKLLQCNVYGNQAAHDLDVQYPPNQRAVSVHFRELEECTALKSLLIICNVDVNDQPNPYIHTYEIEVDETTLSSSNSSVALLAPRPNKCIDVSCTVSNDIGSSTSSRNFCPHDSPAADIISIRVVENRQADYPGNITVHCHVDPSDQPYPPIEEYEVQTEETAHRASRNQSSVIISPLPNKCINITCIGRNQYGMTSSNSSYCPGAHPAEDIITIQYTEEPEENNNNNLTITCHIDPVHQSPIPIDSYTIEIDDVVLSSSDAPYAVFTSRSDRCINVVCTGRNALGATTSSDIYCQGGDVLDIEFEELVGEDYRNLLSISCNVEDRYQPTPPINTFLITASGRILPSSNSSSVTLDPRPETCTRVTCTGQNDFGSTTKSRTFCPTVIADINPWQHSKGFIQEPSTTGALIVVVLVLSMAACFAVFMKKKHYSTDMMN
ncbi:uncharacterized protein [Diadema antillarum]|uniref:uncharacterized protein n=1 Tax=Diadema antillarum TaxID=105358 RepID=UPI003A889A6E